MTKGDKVLHKLHPEWGVGIVVRERWPGWLVQFEKSHTMDGEMWSDMWICSTGHLMLVGEMDETTLHNTTEALNAIRKLRKGKNNES